MITYNDFISGVIIVIVVSCWHVAILSILGTFSKVFRLLRWLMLFL